MPGGEPLEVALVADDLRHLCQKVVGELTSRGGYGYLDPHTLTDRLFQRACNSIDPHAAGAREQVLALCKNTYAAALHAACAGSDPLEQNRAYGELSLYLYRIAYNYLVTRGVPLGAGEKQAEDGVQESLLNIHRNIQHVENPGGFLDYCIQAVTRSCSRAYVYPVRVLADDLAALPIVDPQARATLQNAARSLRQFDASPSTPGLDAIERVAAALQDLRQVDDAIRQRITWIIRQLRRAGRQAEKDLPDDEIAALPGEFSGLTGCKLDCVLEALAQIGNKDQRMVLIMDYFSEFDDQQIATVLSTVKNNIYQLRRRALIAIDRDWLLECLQAC